MNRESQNRIKAAMYNELLIENPIFAEHDRMIEASQKQWVESKKQKKVQKEIN